VEEVSFEAGGDAKVCWDFRHGVGDFTLASESVREGWSVVRRYLSHPEQFWTFPL